VEPMAKFSWVPAGQPNWDPVGSPHRAHLGPTWAPPGTHLGPIWGLAITHMGLPSWDPGGACGQI